MKGSEPSAAPIPRRWVVALYAVMTIMVLAPFFCVHVPCLGDYLNHLARIAILGRLGHSPVLQSFYETHWKFVPYYGMDIPVLLLSRVMSIYAAGRLFMAFCAIMPVIAVCALRAALFGRIGVAPLVAYIFVYNYLLDRGFLTYLFSASLAVIVFAGWIGARNMAPLRRTVLFAAAAMVLYLCHAFAFLTYGLLVAGWQLGDAWRRRFRPWPKLLADVAIAAAQGVPAVIAGWLLGGNDNVTGTAINHYGNVFDKLGAVLSPLYFPDDPFLLPALLFLAVLTALIWRRLRLAPGFRPELLGVMLSMTCVAVITPSVLFNAWGSDFRLPLVLVLVLIAGLTPAALPGRRAAVLVLACIVVLVAGRSASAYVLLRRLDAQVAEIRQVVAALPVGQRLLILDDQKPGPDRVGPVANTAHIGLVAAIDRDAFVPFLFLGNTPIQPRPAMVRSSSRLSTAIDMHDLAEGMAQQDPPGGPPDYGWGGKKYWLGWLGKFDYLLVEHFGDRQEMGARLHLVRAGRIADLYKIE